MDKQETIKQLIWDMACSASEQDISPFITEEYYILYNLGWRFSDYKLNYESITFSSITIQVMFTFLIYYSLP